MSKSGYSKGERCPSLLSCDVGQKVLVRWPDEALSGRSRVREQPEKKLEIAEVVSANKANLKTPNGYTLEVKRADMKPASRREWSVNREREGAIYGY